MTTTISKTAATAARTPDGDSDYLPDAWIPDAVQRMAPACREAIQHDHDGILDFPIPCVRTRSAGHLPASDRTRKGSGTDLRVVAAKTRLRMRSAPQRSAAQRSAAQHWLPPDASWRPRPADAYQRRRTLPDCDENWSVQGGGQPGTTSGWPR
jgi:hypothetical protein